MIRGIKLALSARQRAGECSGVWTKGEGKGRRRAEEESCVREEVKHGFLVCGQIVRNNWLTKPAKRRVQAHNGELFTAPELWIVTCHSFQAWQPFRVHGDVTSEENRLLIVLVEQECNDDRHLICGYIGLRQVHPTPSQKNWSLEECLLSSLPLIVIQAELCLSTKRWNNGMLLSRYPPPPFLSPPPLVRPCGFRCVLVSPPFVCSYQLLLRLQPGLLPSVVFLTHSLLGLEQAASVAASQNKLVFI